MQQDTQTHTISSGDAVCILVMTSPFILAFYVAIAKVAVWLAS